MAYIILILKHKNDCINSYINFKSEEECFNQFHHMYTKYLEKLDKTPSYTAQNLLRFLDKYVYLYYFVKTSSTKYEIYDKKCIRSQVLRIKDFTKRGKTAFFKLVEDSANSAASKSTWNMLSWLRLECSNQPSSKESSTPDTNPNRPTLVYDINQPSCSKTPTTAEYYYAYLQMLASRPYVSDMQQSSVCNVRFIKKDVFKVMKQINKFNCTTADTQFFTLTEALTKLELQLKAVDENTIGTTRMIWQNTIECIEICKVALRDKAAANKRIQEDLFRFIM